MRWLIRSILALCLLVFLAVGAVFLIPAEKVARVATDKFQTITGRTLTIDGAVRPTFWPSLGVKTGAVSISNADWSDAGPMLEAEALEINLDMAALWNGDVRITGIRAKSPRIVLERARDGRENWVFGGKNGGTAKQGMAGEGTPFTLDLAEIEGGSIQFTDHKTGQSISLSQLNGTVKVPAFLGPADVNLSGQMNGQAFATELRLAEFAPFLEGRLTGLDLDLSAGDAKLAFNGRAGFSPLSAAGEMAADLGDMAALSRLLAIPRPALPEGLGARAIAASGAITLTEKASLHLRGGTVTLDGNRLNVEADLTTAGDRPKLSAQVGAGALNLSGLTGDASQGGAASGSGAKAKGWSTERIDVSGLGAMDAAIALSADSVDLGLAKLGTTRVVATIDRARAVFDLRQIAAYQGSVTGQFVVNGRGGLSTGGDLVLSGLAMQPLLTDVAKYDRLIGTGDMTFKFLAVGNSMDELMRSLSGQGKLGFGKGELRGLDLAGMLRTLDTSYVGEGQKTIFDRIGAAFTIQKGVLQNEDLALKAPYVTATGGGEVNVGARTLDYRVRPTALASTDGTGGVMVPLLITGTWANPKFRLDLESLARERFEEEAKALEERAKAEAKAAEARAKAELERKAQEELGVERREGESLEDAAKRRAQEVIEEEADKALRRLLGQP
ncbi:AsmA family protein [Thioclava sp. FR2]|uniref:AsmA family protein n=1 Tax=Thioclava sp. FR2 TaxID=3445780 RepID=UPI003EC0EEF1